MPSHVEYNVVRVLAWMNTYLQNFVVIKHSDSHEGAGFVGEVHWIADACYVINEHVIQHRDISV